MEIEPLNTIVHFLHVTPLPIETVAESIVESYCIFIEYLIIYKLAVRIYQCTNIDSL